MQLLVISQNKNKKIIIRLRNTKIFTKKAAQEFKKIIFHFLNMGRQDIQNTKCK